MIQITGRSKEDPTNEFARALRSIFCGPFCGIQYLSMRDEITHDSPSWVSIHKWKFLLLNQIIAKGKNNLYTMTINKRTLNKTLVQDVMDEVIFRPEFHLADFKLERSRRFN